jgi:hypothetical protein
MNGLKISQNLHLTILQLPRKFEVASPFLDRLIVKLYFSEG